MNIFRSLSFLLVFVIGFFSVSLAHAQSIPVDGRAEIYVDRDGNAKIGGARVVQIAGSTFYARLYWGDTFLRFLIKTGSKTKFTRSLGEATTLHEVKVGDVLSLSGRLESGTDNFILIADSVKDLSIQKEHNKFSGKVTTVESSENRFTLGMAANASITVQLGTSTEIRKGSRVVTLGHLRVGDTIVSVSGEYDYPSKTIKASNVVVYIDPTTFIPKNFQGTFLRKEGDSVVVRINGVEYMVSLEANASVLTNKRIPTTLARFVEGDTVRLYGNIKEVDELRISASILRNLNL